MEAKKRSALNMRITVILSEWNMGSYRSILYCNSQGHFLVWNYCNFHSTMGNITCFFLFFFSSWWQCSSWKCLALECIWNLWWKDQSSLLAHTDGSVGSLLTQIAKRTTHYSYTMHSLHACLKCLKNLNLKNVSPCNIWNRAEQSSVAEIKKKASPLLVSLEISCELL